MLLREVDVMEDSKYYSKKYSLNKTIQLDTLFEVIKFFEGDEFEFFACNCMSYDDTGGTINLDFTSVNDIRKIVNLPSPYVSFSIEFCDKKSKKYKFSITTSINSNSVYYIVDKKKYNERNGQYYDNKSQGRSFGH